jgi:hypothetical protein
MKKRILSKVFILSVAIGALLLGSCALNPNGDNYTAKPLDKKITSVCMPMNPKVVRRGFYLFLIESLENNGITVYKEKNNKCEYYIDYVVHHFGADMHISSADITLYKSDDNSVQGKSTFDISTFNAASFHAHSESVVPAMVNHLLPDQK